MEQEQLYDKYAKLMHNAHAVSEKIFKLSCYLGNFELFRKIINPFVAPAPDKRNFFSEKL